MDFSSDEPLLCPFCGGAKQVKKNIPVACQCTCAECSDNKEFD